MFSSAALSDGVETNISTVSQLLARDQPFPLRSDNNLYSLDVTLTGLPEYTYVGKTSDKQL